MDKDLFCQERSDRKLLDVAAKDRQALKDYSGSSSLFYQLTERTVKVMDTSTFNWDILDIDLVKVDKDDFTLKSITGCCSKR